MRLNLAATSAAAALVLAVGAGAIGGIIATGHNTQAAGPVTSAAPVTVHQVAEEATAPAVEPTASAGPSATSSEIPAAPAQHSTTTTATSSGSSTDTTSDAAPSTGSGTEPAPAPKPAPQSPSEAPTPVVTPKPAPTTCDGEPGMPKSSYPDGAHVGPKYDADGTPVAKSGKKCDAGTWAWDGLQYPTPQCPGGEKVQVSADGYSTKCVDDPHAATCAYGNDGNGGGNFAHEGEKRTVNGVESVCQHDGTWKPV